MLGNKQSLLTKSVIASYILLLTGPLMAIDPDSLMELELEELLEITVETATKRPENYRLSPSIMSVITEKDIKNYGYQTVAEALGYIVGFVDNDDLGMHNFGVRGINSGVRSGSRTIKFMIDGQAVAFSPSSQNFIDAELIPMDLIERIEVVRGPVAALYGANAFLAVVNVVTKSGEEFARTGGAARVRMQSLQHGGSGYGLSITTGGLSGDWAYTAGVSRQSQDRSGVALPRISPDYERMAQQTATDDQADPLSVYARASYQIDFDSSVTLSGHYQQLNADHNFNDINPLTGSGTNRIGLDNLFLRTDYARDLTKQINARAFIVHRQGGTLDDDQIEVGADSFFLERRFGYHSVELGAEIHFELRQTDSLLVGFDNKRETHQIETFSRQQRDSSAALVALSPPRDETLTNNGIYAQYLHQYNDQWRGIFGYRLDTDSVIAQQSSARLGLVGQLSPQIVVKFLAGSSFQAPSPELLYRTAVQAGDIIGNPELKAQKADTFEVSMAYRATERLHMNVTLFTTQVDDLVVFESNGNNLFANNSSASRTHGVEVDLRYFWRGVKSYLNFSQQKTRRDPNLQSLFVLEQARDGTLYPEQSANWGLSYFWLQPQINVSWNNRWVGERRASTQNSLLASQFYDLDSYLESNLTLSTERFSLLSGKSANLMFQVHDLFDSQFVNPGFGGIDFPSLGRRFSLSFEQRF